MASTRQHRKPKWGLGEYAPSNEGRQEITELVLQAGLPLLLTILPPPVPYRAGHAQDCALSKPFAGSWRSGETTIRARVRAKGTCTRAPLAGKTDLMPWIGDREV